VPQHERQQLVVPQRGHAAALEFLARPIVRGKIFHVLRFCKKRSHAIPPAIGGVIAVSAILRRRQD
jgi:hypothetical protein